MPGRFKGKVNEKARVQQIMGTITGQPGIRREVKETSKMQKHRSIKKLVEGEQVA